MESIKKVGLSTAPLHLAPPLRHLPCWGGVPRPQMGGRARVVPKPTQCLSHPPCPYIYTYFFKKKFSNKTTSFLIRFCLKTTTPHPAASLSLFTPTLSSLSVSSSYVLDVSNPRRLSLSLSLFLLASTPASQPHLSLSLSQSLVLDDFGFFFWFIWAVVEPELLVSRLGGKHTATEAIPSPSKKGIIVECEMWLLKDQL